MEIIYIVQEVGKRSYQVHRNMIAEFCLEKGIDEASLMETFMLKNSTKNERGISYFIKKVETKKDLEKRLGFQAPRKRIFRETSPINYVPKPEGKIKSLWKKVKVFVDKVIALW